MRLFRSFTLRKTAPAESPALPDPFEADDQEFSEDLTEEQRERVFRRIALGRWRHAANPTSQEMDHLRQVLPQVLTREHFSRIDAEQMADLTEALATGGNVSACLRRNGLGLPHPRNDVVMSLVWLACGEGDGLARLWMIDALSRVILESNGEDAVEALASMREHMDIIGLGRLTFDDENVRALLRDLAIGPVSHEAKAPMPDHDTAVSAHLDGLVALRMAPGWRESHARALRRLGTRPVPPRPSSPRQIPEPDEDFSFSTQDEDDFPLPPPPDVPETAQTIRVVPAGFSTNEKHLRRFSTLERPLALVGADDVAGLGPSLAEEFPWLAEAVAHVAGSQALRARGSRPWFAFSPMLLVGPQGAGKTRFGRRLSELAGVPMTRLNASGQSGAIEILGHSPTYREAHPSAPVSAMAEHAVANPILFIDEVDKFGSSDYNGDPRNAIIPMLEQETARAFHDDFLRADVDVSQVSFIFTANTIHGLPTPLLDRLEIFHVGVPGPEHFDAIVGNVVREVAAEHGLSEAEMPPLHPLAMAAMRKAFVRGTSIRRLKSAVQAAMQVSASHAPH